MTRPSLFKTSILLAALATTALTGWSALAAESATVSVLVPGYAKGVTMHGMNGVGWGTKDGVLYATSGLAGTLYRIDPKTGEVSIEVPYPLGGGDDVAQAPDGSLSWTANHDNELRIKRPGGKVEAVATNVPGINPVAFRADGRLVAAQINIPHPRVLEVDPTGKTPPRQISIDEDDINSFNFGPDGLLYAPAMKVGKAISLNIDTGERKVLAEGFGRFASVKMNSRGQLIGLESRLGHISRIDPKTGKVERIVSLPPIVDNVAIGPDDTIYVSSPPDSSVFAIDPNTNAVRDLVRNQFSAIGMLDFRLVDGKDTIIAADDSGWRLVDAETGKVTRRPYHDLEPGQSGGGGSALAITNTMVAVARVRDGVVQKIERATEKVVFETKEIKHPYGMVLMGDGSVLVADYDVGRIARLTETGLTTIADGLAGPVGLAWANGSTLLVSEAGKGQITAVTIATGKKNVVARGLAQPEGVLVLPDGRIVVAETGANKVTLMDRAGKNHETLAENLPFGAQILDVPEKVGLPAGLTMDRAGAIYVSCDGDNSIRKIVLAKK